TTVSGGEHARSSLTIPLEAGGRVFGSLAFQAFSGEVVWPEDLVQRLHLVAEVFASAVGRREADDALRMSELMNSAILASLSSGVAVLDHQGRIIAVNDSWRRFAAANESWHFRLGVSANYLQGCADAATQGVDHARDALAGIEGVLAGSRSSFA